MKIFRKDADYAVRALIFLALRESREPIPAGSLAVELGLPVNYLRRICSTLTGAGFLETREGKHGGVILAVKPGTINLLNLVELFQGPPEISDCTFRKKLCPNRKTCVLRKRILGIESDLAERFRTITIQTLLDDLASL